MAEHSEPMRFISLPARHDEPHSKGALRIPHRPLMLLKVAAEPEADSRQRRGDFTADAEIVVVAQVNVDGRNPAERRASATFCQTGSCAYHPWPTGYRHLPGREMGLPGGL